MQNVWKNKNLFFQQLGYVYFEDYLLCACVRCVLVSCEWDLEQNCSNQRSWTFLVVIDRYVKCTFWKFYLYIHLSFYLSTSVHFITLSIYYPSVPDFFWPFRHRLASMAGQAHFYSSLIIFSLSRTTEINRIQNAQAT